MEYRRFGDDIVVRMDKGDEILAKVKEIALKEHITLAHVSALGAVDRLTVGVYHLDEKAYKANTFTGNYEIVSLTGSIDTMDGQFYTHLHLSAGDEEGHVVGGHLNEAFVSVTCEMFIHIIHGEINRKKDPDIGINLFDFSTEQSA